MSKHTPGPWEVAGTWVQTADENRTPIANLNFFAATNANTRLIAAAPNLLEALKSAKWMLERDRIDDQKMAVIEKCDAAIAKATGAA